MSVDKLGIGDYNSTVSRVSVDKLGIGDYNNTVSRVSVDKLGIGDYNSKSCVCRQVRYRGL